MHDSKRYHERPPGLSAYSAILQFGKVSVSLPKLQNIDEVAIARQDVGKTRNVHFSYPSRTNVIKRHSSFSDVYD